MPLLSTASPQPFSISSCPAPLFDTTTGVPHASDSRIVKPNVSYGLGAITTSTLAIISASSLRSEIRPRNVTSNPSAVASNLFLIAPSPAIKSFIL